MLKLLRSGDFEAVTSYGLGVERAPSFTVTTLRGPDRLIGHADELTTVNRKPWLFSQKRFGNNQLPFYVAVPRPVLSSAPAAALRDRSYAGPTLSEYRQGLKTLLSESTGFADLRIADQVSRVCLNGEGNHRPRGHGHAEATAHCEVVNIAGPNGQTERPTGGDSIPDCFEP